MKKLLIILFLLGVLFSNTNKTLISTNNITNVNISTDYLDKRAIFLKQGSLFKIPHTGWFFNLVSTERLLIADTEAPKLRAENTELKAMIAGLKYSIEWYKFGFEVTKELLPKTDSKSKWKAGLSDGGKVMVGIFIGAGTAIAITFAVNKASN